MTDVSNNTPEIQPPESNSEPAMQAKRKKMLGFLALILIIAAILYAIWAIFLITRSIPTMPM
jgi:membrane fusion protein (multidrug efflux system)